MRHLLISVAAAVAVAGAATMAAAQDEKGKAPGVDQQTPGAGKAEKAPQKSMPPRETGSDQSQTSQPREDRDKDRHKAAQPDSPQQPKTTQQQSPDSDRPKAAQQPKADQDRPNQDGPKATQQRKATEEDRRKAAEPSIKDTQKAAEPKQQPGKDKSAQRDGDKASPRVQVSEEQRTDIRRRLVEETRVEKTRINVTVNIGRTIPRSVRLHTLPVGIVAIAPAYRGYHYVVLEDETIVIVDPRTYVVVDTIVVDARRADRPGGVQLALSPADRRFLSDTLPRHRTADVRVRLALGAEVPRSVELLAFPPAVVERVPQVRHYRYIVADDDIVIVDPSDYGVALLIED